MRTRAVAALAAACLAAIAVAALVLASGAEASGAEAFREDVLPAVPVSLPVAGGGAPAHTGYLHGGPARGPGRFDPGGRLVGGLPAGRAPPAPGVPAGADGGRRDPRALSFSRHVDAWRRAEKKVVTDRRRRTHVFSLVPEKRRDYTVVSGAYVARALASPSMAWFAAAVGGSPANLFARGAGSWKEYAARHAASIEKPGDVPPTVLAKLRNASGIAREAVEAAVASGAGPPEMAALLRPPVWPVRVAVVGDGAPRVEGGLPHTVHDVVVLPRSVVATSSARRLAWLLVHEAAHVYQRLAPAEARAVLRRDFGFVPAASFAAGASEKPVELYPLHALYRFLEPGSPFSFAPRDASAPLPEWRDASQAHARGELGDREAAEFHLAHAGIGLPPGASAVPGTSADPGAAEGPEAAEDPGASDVPGAAEDSGASASPGAAADPGAPAAPEVRANPDADALAWVRVVRRPESAGQNWPGPEAAGWPGGVLFVPAQRFSSARPGFGDVRLGGGDDEALGARGEHPHEVMAYAWQRIASDARAD